MSRTERIQNILNQALTPSYVNVENESHKHHVPKDSETHFKITVVSPRFEELKRIMRHKLVNQLMSTEFETGLHALSMHLFTAEEWELREQTVQKSPACKDGFDV